MITKAESYKSDYSFDTKANLDYFKKKNFIPNFT